MTPPAHSQTLLLEMKNIVKEYRGVAALKDIDFDLRRGEVHAILGENGAGKSTLVKILSGAVAPSAGEILLDGQRIQISGPASARRHGIAMVYQETSLVPTLTVAQNLYLGDEKFFNRLRGTYIEAQQLLQSLNFPVDPTAIVQSLGTAKRQMVEIARAVRLTGIFWLVGSSRTETAKIVAGAAKRDLFHGGDIRFDGRSDRILVSRQGRRRALAQRSDVRSGNVCGGVLNSAPRPRGQIRAIRLAAVPLPPSESTQITTGMRAQMPA
jgi:ABC-type Fe3+/spermidine/putrescine transport system ATPase subunit